MSEISQGDWDDVDFPRIPRWPSKTGEKRPLRVYISTWVGTSPGARHMYAEVKEKENEYWSEKNNTWVDVSCSTESKGYYLKADVFTLKEAVEIATKFVEMIAGKKRIHHVVSWIGPGRPRWAKESLMGEF